MTRVAVVGTGSAGMRHLRTLGAMPDVRVVAVPVRESRVSALRDAGFEATVDVARACADGLDGVVVATDPGRHLADVERWIARAPVLLEKPSAPSLADARRIADLARGRGRAVHVAFCLRFDPGLRWLRSRRDAIGHASAVDVECLSWLPDWRPDRPHRESYSSREGEGGVLLDLVHEVDYASWIFGPVVRVQARLRNAGLVGVERVEETASLLLETRDVDVTMRLSYAVRPSSRRLLACGDAGTLEWDGVRRVASVRSASGETLDALAWEDRSTMYVEQASAWLRSLRGEAAGDLVDADQACHPIAVCDAAKAAAASGRAVAVPAAAP